jgi:dihydrofolate synthase/folylpolyglutamate synthase
MPDLSSSLADWLDYQQRVHPREVALGLARVRRVWERLGAPRPAPVVITVGGTNGKGSTVAFLEAMLAAAGHRVGAFTSPHLLHYNERVRIDGATVSDASLVQSFVRIEAARGDIALTYFEFGTLAALLLMADAGCGVALLEVGLGGRLDAVNLVDADAAIVTTVDLDHQDYLGSDLDGIGREKAGIFRHGRPAIIGDSAPVAGLLGEARRIGADVRLAGRDFQVESVAGAWHWRDGVNDLALPPPHLDAPCQPANAAAAIAALAALAPVLGWSHAAVAQGVATACLAARMQGFGSRGECRVDVAHNPQAARVLAQWLAAQPAGGRTLAVFGALRDKDIGGIVASLAPCFDAWHLADMSRESDRGASIAELHQRVDAVPGIHGIVAHDSLDQALAQAFADARPDDRIVAFGSFFVAAAALRFLAERGMTPR